MPLRPPRRLPTDVASDLNLTAAQLDRIWSDAIHWMFDFINPRAPGAPEAPGAPGSGDRL